MRLVTLGTGTVSLQGDRACAGHVVEAGAVRLLLDCGTGVGGRLAAHGVDWMGITHVAITHFHADHFSDLATLIYAWRYGRMEPRRLPGTLVGPPGFARLVEGLATLFGDTVRDPGFPLAVVELPPDGTLALGEGVVLGACKVPHTEESVAYSVTAGGRRLVYTGDTGPDERFARWAAGADVLLAECSLPDAIAVPGHLTPGRCAALAETARPGHLVLTHFFPNVLDTDVAATIGARYAGPVTLAHDGWSIELEAR